MTYNVNRENVDRVLLETPVFIASNLIVDVSDS